MTANYQTGRIAIIAIALTSFLVASPASAEGPVSKAERDAGAKFIADNKDKLSAKALKAGATAAAKRAGWLAGRAAGVATELLRTDTADAPTMDDHNRKQEEAKAAQRAAERAASKY